MLSPIVGWMTILVGVAALADLVLWRGMQDAMRGRLRDGAPFWPFVALAVVGYGMGILGGYGVVQRDPSMMSIGVGGFFSIMLLARLLAIPFRRKGTR